MFKIGKHDVFFNTDFFLLKHICVRVRISDWYYQVKIYFTINVKIKTKSLILSSKMNRMKEIKIK